MFSVSKCILQAVYMRVTSELMVRHGMTCQTHVPYVFAVRALFSVRRCVVHPPTVTTLSRDSAACPVMVSEKLNRNMNFLKICLSY